MAMFKLLQTSSCQEYQFYIATDHLVVKNGNVHIDYWHLVVKNGNFTLLLISSGQEWQFHIATDSPVDQEWQFHYCYWQIQWLGMVISHCYWHLVVNNGNFTMLLTSSGQEWQFFTTTDIKFSGKDNFTLLLISSDQEWQFHIATDI